MRVLERSRLLAMYDNPVLILGETGTGKDVIARAIHHQSSRSSGPFVRFPCGLLSAELFENELLGHAAGAYTDAAKDQRGVLASAEGGTLLLDEVETLPHQSQAKLLWLLERSEYRVLGSERVNRADVRIVACCNVDLGALVGRKSFRADLYYRLSHCTITMPALRERIEDILLLAAHFFDVFCEEHAIVHPGLSQCALAALTGYSWPGNVRELKNRVSQAIILSDGKVIEPSHLELASGINGTEVVSFEEARERHLRTFEREYLERLLRKFSGNVHRAASAAQLSRRTLYRLMMKHGVSAATTRDCLDPEGAHLLDTQTSL